MINVYICSSKAWLLKSEIRIVLQMEVRLSAFTNVSEVHAALIKSLPQIQASIFSRYERARHFSLIELNCCRV